MTTFLAQPSAPTGEASTLVAPKTTRGGMDGRRVGASPVRAGGPTTPPNVTAGLTQPRGGARTVVTEHGRSHPKDIGPQDRTGQTLARAAYFRKPEDWRLRGRPFDPRQRTLSRGEQRVQMADRLVYGSSGVLGALMVLYAIASAVLR